MRRLLLVLPVLAACVPPGGPAPSPTTTTTTTVPARVCLDPATLHSWAIQGGVTVWYANDRGIGPYPIGVSGADGCVEPYTYWAELDAAADD